MRARRALFSVSDKTGIVGFARELTGGFGFEILSTGGTARVLRDAGIGVTDVSEITSFPEIMDGRVKTLHPLIHGGILARRDDPGHIRQMEENGIFPIDVIVVNLYPFAATVAGGRDDETCIENIDVGGPAMIRASAKNHEFVAVVTDPADYAAVLEDMKKNAGATGIEMRRDLAAKAFALTACYDSDIAAWFRRGADFPERMRVTGNLKQTLRYGENPHQRAALYLDGSARPGVATARQMQGKELSYNNLNDTDAALELVTEFDEPAVAIIKHANPCGVAVSPTPAGAYKKALACDPVSAFGGIVSLNRPLDAETATEIVRIFSEVIIAPSVDPAALEILGVKPNLRVLVTGGMPEGQGRRILVKSIAGGFLAQDADVGDVSRDDLKIVTRRIPTAAETEDMLFAFRVAKHVKSNAVVFARDRAAVGIGAGQMSRIDSTRIAAWKMKEAGLQAGGHLAVASDAFFPFADGLIAAAEAGATAVIQPGGSVRDAEVIAAADEKGVAMAFTGTRHFRH